MKKYILLVLFFICYNAQSQIGIGISNPDASAVLDLTSTNKGVLLPRLTTLQRDAIVNPAEGLTIFNTNENCLEWYNGSYWYNACGNNISVVVGAANRTWMAYNLGATAPATSLTDSAQYGDYYQWGRNTDGHEKKSSAVNSATSASDTPNHSDFIDQQDWRTTSNNNLWQQGTGTNNPCPAGFRIPTRAEWEAECVAAKIVDEVTAYNSPLKLPAAGFRDWKNKGINGHLGVGGIYWASDPSSTNNKQAIMFGFRLGKKSDKDTDKGNGLSVRCIKN